MNYKALHPLSIIYLYYSGLYVFFILCVVSYVVRNALSAVGLSFQQLILKNSKKAGVGYLLPSNKSVHTQLLSNPTRPLYYSKFAKILHFSDSAGNYIGIRLAGTSNSSLQQKKVLFKSPESIFDCKKILSGGSKTISECKKTLSGSPETISECKKILSGSSETIFEYKEVLSGNQGTILATFIQQNKSILI